MALTEGMQYGCVPFTFNNYCAAFDIIQDGVDGCLVPAFNLKRYSSLLSKLMMDDNKRIKMSRAAMEKVRRFSVENVVDKWEDVFNGLVIKSTNIG
jgi:glycosyltransferase involved in cell wall biosynthesis